MVVEAVVQMEAVEVVLGYDGLLAVVAKVILLQNLMNDLAPLLGSDPRTCVVASDQLQLVQRQQLLLHQLDLHRQANTWISSC